MQNIVIINWIITQPHRIIVQSSDHLVLVVQEPNGHGPGRNTRDKFQTFLGMVNTVHSVGGWPIYFQAGDGNSPFEALFAARVVALNVQCDDGHLMCYLRKRYLCIIQVICVYLMIMDLFGSQKVI
jgi:hypothetical protein